MSPHLQLEEELTAERTRRAEVEEALALATTQAAEDEPEITIDVEAPSSEASEAG